MSDNSTNNDKDKKQCSFCFKSQHEVKKLIAGPSCYICNECIDLCHEIISDDKLNKKEEDIYFKASTPKDIKNILDDYVIQQNFAKKILSVAIYNHYKRIRYNRKSDPDHQIDKSNILLIGPTGCGKTLLVQTMAKILNVPIAISDATSLTESGYVGDDVENIVARLLQAADFNIEKTEKGIIYIDEIDKIARRSDSHSMTRDISGEGVQQSLLKVIEGSVISVPSKPGRKTAQQEYVQINTKNILFICGGAFSGLEKIISNRKGAGGIGFNAKLSNKNNENNSHLLKDARCEDVIKYGIIPELAGRLPIIANLDELTENDLCSILTDPKDSIISQYKALFQMEDVNIDFTHEALHEIAKKAIAKKIGARGLRSIIEEHLLDIMYESPSIENLKSIKINDKVITDSHKPKFIKRSNKDSKKEDKIDSKKDLFTLS